MLTASTKTQAMSFPHSSVSKESACNAGDLGSIPRLGRFPGEGNGNVFQYSCLENPVDRGTWHATVYRVERVGHNLATKPLRHSKNFLLLLSRFSHVCLCMTPQTAAHQALPSLGFSRQEHWSGLPFPSPTHGSEK